MPNAFSASVATLLLFSALAGSSACTGTFPGAEDDPSSGGASPSSGGKGQPPSAGRGGTFAGGVGGGAVPLAGAAGRNTAGMPQAGSGGSGGSAGVDAPPARALPQSPTASWVFVDGYRLWVGRRRADGSLETPAPFKMKGVGWSPTAVGQSNDGGYRELYTQHAGSDAPLMSELHANSVKTYDAFERNGAGNALLDDLYSRGIMVVMSVLIAHGSAEGKQYREDVDYFKNHPAILMWLVGNEFNYNNLYGAGSYAQARAIVQTAIADIHAADPDHPVAVSFGEVPSLAQYNELSQADVWSINLYPGLDFGSRFNNWANLSNKPFFVGEYGADAYDSTRNQENQSAQSAATTELTEQIRAQYSADNPSHCVLGGAIYSLSDEWWKDGNSGGHDTGGFENAIHPDGFANEEWWGLVTIQRGKRAAFNALANLYAQP